MTHHTQGNQDYTQWGLWYQAPQDSRQGQVPWNTQQQGWQAPQSCWPGYGQDAWTAYQPVYNWQARQEDWRQQALWNKRQPDCDWQAWQEDWQGQEVPLEEDPFAACEAALPELPKPSKAVNYILNILCYCFVVFLLAGSTMFAFSNNADKSLFGYRFYNVLTPSMKPFFKPGDMIFVRLAEPSQIKEGDVVTFHPSSKSTAFLTHRVVGLLPADEAQPARMVTKGDYNNAEDPPVRLDAVIGVHVFTIPMFGRVVEMMRSNLLLVCVCLGAVFLLLTVLRAYFAVRRQEKRKAYMLSALARAKTSRLRIFTYPIWHIWIWI